MQEYESMEGHGRVASGTKTESDSGDEAERRDFQRMLEYIIFTMEVWTPACAGVTDKNTRHRHSGEGRNPHTLVNRVFHLRRRNEA